jgi:hypothetical protein
MSRNITKYQLFGERNSGTNYLATQLDENFDLKKTWEHGFKHWFIKEHYPRGRPNETTDFECLRGLEDSADTLFIYIIREPFSWLSAMHRRPYYASKLKNIPFDEFIHSRWHSLNPNGDFIEEAENICDLRNQKNQHFIKLKTKVDNFHIIRQEYLLEDLEDLAKKQKLPPKNNQVKLLDYRPPVPSHDISSESREFIISQLDWNTEFFFGYKKNSTRQQPTYSSESST